MRFQKFFSRWKGAVAAGMIVIGTDVAPTVELPGVQDRLVSSPVFSSAGAPAKAIAIALKAPAGAGPITCTLYVFERETNTWHVVGAGAAVTPGTLAYFDVPAPLERLVAAQARSAGGIDAILQVDDPGGLPDGEYRFALAASASKPEATGGGGGTITSILAGSGISIAGGTGPATTITANSTIQRATKVAIETTLGLTNGIVSATAGVLSVATTIAAATVAPGTVGQVLATTTGPVASWVTPAGDVTGAPGASVVERVNGATVPAAGALTTGNVLKVTGVGALGYGAVDLAGGANHVTGLLPIANLAAPNFGSQAILTSGTLGAGASTLGATTVTTLGIGTLTGVVKAASGTISAAALVNTDVDAAAAIVASKLNLTTIAQNIANTGTFANTGTVTVTGNIAVSGVSQGASFRFGAAGATQTSGTGAPASGEADGSIYQRTDGAAATTLYVRAAGAWTALGGGGGSSITWANDLATSSDSSQNVVSLTGASAVIPIAATGNVFTWAAATTAPGMTQTAVGSGTGADMTISAQGAGSGTGGNLRLFGGTATTKGAVLLGVNDGVAFATAGTVRMQKAVSIRALNNAGSGNLNLASCDTSDFVTYGGTVNAGLIIGTATGGTILSQINGTTVTTMQTGTSAVAALLVNSATSASLALQLQTAGTEAWSFGRDATSVFQRTAGTVAATGLLRLANNLGAIIVQRNSGNTDDMPILEADATSVYLGINVAGTKQVTTTTINGSSTVNLMRNGGNFIILNSGGITVATTFNLVTNSLVIAGSNTPTWVHTARTGNTVGLDWTFRAQGADGSATGVNRDGAALLFQGGNRSSGATTGRRRGIRMSIASTDAPLIEICDVQAGTTAPSRAVILNRGAAITATEMPTNTGDLVVYIGNCATAPTANSVSGGILYSEAGALKWRGTGGTVTTLGAA